MLSQSNGETYTRSFRFTNTEIAWSFHEEGGGQQQDERAVAFLHAIPRVENRKKESNIHLIKY